MAGKKCTITTKGTPDEQQLAQAASTQARAHRDNATWMRKSGINQWDAAFTMKAAGVTDTATSKSRRQLACTKPTQTTVAHGRGIVGPDNAPAGKSLHHQNMHGDSSMLQTVDRPHELTTSGGNVGGQPCSQPAAPGRPRTEGRLLTMARSVSAGRVTAHIGVEHRIPENVTPKGLQSELRTEGCAVNVAMSRSNEHARERDAASDCNSGCVMITRQRNSEPAGQLPPPVVEASGRMLAQCTRKEGQLLLPLAVYGMVDPNKSTQHEHSHEMLCAGMQQVIAKAKDRGAHIVCYTDAQVVAEADERTCGELQRKDKSPNNMLRVLSAAGMHDVLRQTGRKWMTCVGKDEKGKSMIDTFFVCPATAARIGGVGKALTCITQTASPCSVDHRTMCMGLNGEWGGTHIETPRPSLDEPRVTRYKLNADQPEERAQCQHALTNGPVSEALQSATATYRTQMTVTTGTQHEPVAFTTVARAMNHLGVTVDELNGQGRPTNTTNTRPATAKLENTARAADSGRKSGYTARNSSGKNAANAND